MSDLRTAMSLAERLDEVNQLERNLENGGLVSNISFHHYPRHSVASIAATLGISESEFSRELGECIRTLASDRRIELTHKLTLLGVDVAEDRG